LKKLIFNLRAVFIAFFLLLAFGYMASIVISVITFTRVIEYPTTPKQSTILPTTTTRKPPKVNTCWRDRHTSPTFPNQGYKPTKVEAKYFQSSKIYAMVEICIPERQYIVNLATSLVLLDDKGVRLQNVAIDFYFDLNNIDMVASDSEILIIDGSDTIYRFDFDLQYLRSINVVRGTFKVSLYSFFYESQNQLLYVNDRGQGFHVFNKSFKNIDFLPLKQEEFIKFQVENETIHIVRMADSVYLWDVFCSYNWGSQRKNQTKVREIRSNLIRELNITAWMDIFEMQSGQLSQKIFEGIANSKVFICFLTPSYLESINCINELCLAKKLAKEMIFIVTDDPSNNIEELIEKKAPAGFYKNELKLLRNEQELVDKVRQALKNQVSIL
jgi:hypothetical protein